MTEQNVPSTTNDPKTSQSTAVVLSTPIAQGIEKVNAKLAKLQIVMDSSFKTSGVMTGVTSSPIDISKEQDVRVLLRCLSTVIAKEEAYNKAAQAIDLKQYPEFNQDGGTVKHWTEDIKLRIAVIQSKEMYDKLMSYKNRYTELMDKNDKLALLDQELASL